MNLIRLISMRKPHNLYIFIFSIFTFSLYGSPLEAKTFVEKLSVYGVIKPAEMTTMIGVNHGVVLRVYGQVGDRVQRGKASLAVIEKETTRY